MTYLVQNESAIAYILDSQGNIDEERLQILNNQLLGQQMQQSQQQQQQHNYNSPYSNYSIETVPSRHEILSRVDPKLDKYSSYPPIREVPKKRGAKGSVACKLFFTPEGCRFGDKCDFSHTKVPTGLSLNGPGARRGLGGNRRK